jgi:hypothetical protein
MSQRTVKRVNATLVTVDGGANIEDVLLYKIGDLVKFTVEAIDIHSIDKKKIWIVKDYVNKDPEECSIYDYILTDASEEIVAIEYEITKLEGQ